MNSFEIAHIQLAFNQSTLIELLTDRGYAMLGSFGVGDVLEKYNKSINDYINNPEGMK
jgi:hypothetical protein